MAPEEIQAELDKCRDIILATIDHTIQKEASQLKPEQVAYSMNFHRLWKEQIDLQYQSKDLKKLRKSLDTVTFSYKATGDIDFLKYIKEKTGFDFDLFGNIQERIDKIIARGWIANGKETLDIATIIQLYRKTGVGQENAHVLHNLRMTFTASKRKKKKVEGEVLPDINYLCEINSPDNKRYVTMYESHYAAYPSTMVNISFENGVTSSMYAAKAVNLGIKIRWKDNNTIVIELHKDCEVLIKDTLTQHLGDIIKVEYPES